MKDKYKYIFFGGILLILLYKQIYNMTFLDKYSILCLGIVISIYGAFGLVINDKKDK